MAPRVLGPFTLFASLLVLCASSPALAQSAGEPLCPVSFDLERPDTLGAIGVQSSLVTDSQGRPHIAYRNASGSQIRYARKEGAAWIVELLPQTGRAHGISLALDAEDNPYIAYGVQEPTSVGVVTSTKLATRSGDRWTLERIELAFPGEAVIAFDPAGVLHAVYFGFGVGYVIRYATRTDAGWTAETLFPTSGLGAGRFSLAFDAQGRPHATAQVFRAIIHAFRSETGWVVDKQPPAEGVSLALDAQGTPHVAAHVRVPPAVQYRTRQNGIWNVETVDEVDAGSESSVSLAIDRFGRPILAYFDMAMGTLKVAWKDGESWVAQVVDAGGVGEAPSLSISDAHRSRISYFDAVGFDLRLASGEIPLPNLGPTADAGGPYTGTTGEGMTFDGTGSSDPEGHALAYAWNFGDAVQGTGVSPMHAFAAAGTYDVCLTVTDDGCPTLTDTKCASATVREALAVRVFRVKKNRINIQGQGGRERHCFRIEPLESAFRMDEIDPSTVAARFDTTRVSSILGKSAVASDTDGNGVLEMEVCFTSQALEALFAAAPHGKSEVTMKVEAALNSGARVQGEVAFEIKKHRDCGGACAGISPNPLNPDAMLTFTTTTSGSVEVEMFDVQGRLLGAILERTFLPAGTHEVRIQGSDPRPLSSGVYFYRIRTPERSVTGRFTILK